MLSILLLLLPMQLTPAAPPIDEVDRIPFEELVSSSTYQKYIRKTNYHDRIKVLREAFERRTDRVPAVVDERNILSIFRALAELRGIGAEAHRISKTEKNAKELRHKEVKRLEIVLRKLTELLENQKLSVPLENRGEFNRTVEYLEEVRDLMLRQLFGAAIGSLHTGAPRQLVHSFLPTSARAAPSSSNQGLRDLDRFTEEEFTKVQYARKLDKRVEVFLEIAEHRMDEIERRVKGKEWEEKEPNLLEFYTYEDLLFGYVRAVDGVMTNIDAQVESQMVEEKDLMKSLKKLDEEIKKLIPRLQGLEDLVRQQRDEDLYHQWRKALETSEIAMKGAAFGLGAPKE